MNNALRRTVRSFGPLVSARLITCRSFVTENLKIQDLNKDGNSGDVNHTKINIWWDLRSCKLPTYCDAGSTISNIRDGLRRIHCFGPIEFWAYGDMKLLLSETMNQLHNNGVKLRHVPRRKFKDTEAERDYVMVADVMAWNTDHPPPAIHLIMSAVAESDFALGQLEMLVDQSRVGGYDTLLVVTREAFPLPIAGPKGIWQWETLVASPSCENGFPTH